MRLTETYEAIKLDKLILESEFKFIAEASISKTSDNDVMNILYEVLEKFNLDNVYISFRDSVTVNLINPTNIYKTPTGFYCYPLSAIIKEKMKIKNLEDIKNMPKEKFFSSQFFPWRSESEYLYIFHISDTSDVLYSSKDNTDKINRYVLKLKELYNKNEKVVAICDTFLDKGYVTSTRYKDNFSGMQGLWMLIFEIGILLNKQSSLNYFFTIVCFKIGISGFVDDAGKSFIHQNEPFNAVFFRLKTISDYFKILSKSRGVKFALPRSTDIIGRRYSNKKHKYEKSTDIPRI